MSLAVNHPRPRMSTAQPMANRATVQNPSRRRRNRQRRAANSRALVPNQPRRQVVAVPRPVFTLDECTRKYATAVASPWNAEAGACVPSTFPVPSQRLKFFSRFTMEVGDQGSGTGVGFINIAPALLCSLDGNGTANTGAAIYYSTSAFAGSGVNRDSSVTGVSAANSNAPFDHTFGGNIKYRFVTGGLRIRYTGKVTDCNGVIYGLVNPSHAGLAGGTGPAGLSNWVQTKIERPSADEHYFELPFGPAVAPDETDFQPIDFSSPDSWTNPSVTIVVTGTTGLSFFGEVYCHVEYAGVGARGLVTDVQRPEGRAAVASVWQRSALETQSWPRLSTFLSQVARAMPPVLTTAAAIAGAATGYSQAGALVSTITPVIRSGFAR